MNICINGKNYFVRAYDCWSHAKTKDKKMTGIRLDISVVHEKHVLEHDEIRGYVLEKICELIQQKVNAIHFE